MSLFGALATAVSGLSGQAAAFSNISDNIANSQTTGYKRVDTSFQDILATSDATTNQSGSVVAQPLYQNDIQGSITQNDNPLSFAISGEGFFSVSRPTQAVNGATTFAPQTYYTRAGDFQLNKEGYLVNSEGDYLNGWQVNESTGAAIENAVAPIQVDQTVDSPVATANVTLAANLPSYTNILSPPAVVTSNVSVYDAQGASHQLTLTFTPDAATADQWNLAVTDDATPANTIGGGTVLFGADGTLASVTPTIPSTGSPAVAAGAAATLGLVTAYPSDDTATNSLQNINLNFGTIGGTSGLTQYAGTSYTLRGISQDGVPPGAFSSLTNTASGDIVANFDNGQSRVVAQVPLMTFAAPDSLQRQDGSAFSATIASGDALAHEAGTSGAGTLTTSAAEASNVDIGTEFSQLIVAQQAYSANAKLVTTANQMLQTTIDMKQ